VFATLDSGVRGSQTHDASAVVYVGCNVHMQPYGLYVLDWEAVELGAGDLELWLVAERRHRRISRSRRRHPEQPTEKRQSNYGLHFDVPFFITFCAAACTAFM
jgi:hypothetical protein